VSSVHLANNPPQYLRFVRLLLVESWALQVIVQLVSHYVDQKQPLLDAVKSALGRLEGTWGIVLISKDDPSQLIAVRHVVSNGFTSRSSSILTRLQFCTTCIGPQRQSFGDWARQGSNVRRE